MHKGEKFCNDYLLMILNSKEIFTLLSFALLIATLTQPLFKRGDGKALSIFGVDGKDDCLGTCPDICKPDLKTNSSCNAIKALLVMATVFTGCACLMNFSLFPSVVMPAVLPSVSSLLSLALLFDLLAFIILMVDDESNFGDGNKSLAESTNGGPFTQMDGFHTAWASIVALFIASVLCTCGCVIVC